MIVSNIMEQNNFAEALVAACNNVPEKHRRAVLHIVEILARQLREPQAGVVKGAYDIERHREVRRLSASIRGSLASAVIAEREERG
jgi:hypothetical protein